MRFTYSKPRRHRSVARDSGEKLGRIAGFCRRAEAMYNGRRRFRRKRKQRATRVEVEELQQLQRPSLEPCKDVTFLTNQRGEAVGVGLSSDGTAEVIGDGVAAAVARLVFASSRSFSSSG